MKRPVGEVISASTTELTAGCYDLGKAPDFGSIVAVSTRDQNTRIFAIVADIQTGSREPGGRAIVRGRAGSYDDQIYEDNPDLAELLQTEFSALVIGFQSGETIYQYLPPQPAPIHYSVFECEAPEMKFFTDNLDYLRTILAAKQFPSEEMLAANIRLAHESREEDPDFLVRAGREVAKLLPEDYDRLNAILKRFLPQPTSNQR
jgi:hypothetical protein